MQIEHGGKRPQVHESAYVAPNAVLSGEVRIGPGSCVLFGAVITADGGPVEIGSHCVVMENAVVRGTPRHPARLGDNVLVGPNAHVSGCSLEDGVFVATGAAVFNGVVVGEGSEVRIGAVVHVNSVLPPGSMVPINWVAVGDPAEILPPDRPDRIWPIQRSMDFRGTVWGVDRSVARAEVIRRYARGLARHRGDKVLDEE